MARKYSYPWNPEGLIADDFKAWIQWMKIKHFPGVGAMRTDDAWTCYKGSVQIAKESFDRGFLSGAQSNSAIESDMVSYEETKASTEALANLKVKPLSHDSK